MKRIIVGRKRIIKFVSAETLKLHSRGQEELRQTEVTLEDVKRNILTDTLIRFGNTNLAAMGFTEHGYRHINLVANIAQNVTKRLGFQCARLSLPPLPAICMILATW